MNRPPRRKSSLRLAPSKQPKLHQQARARAKQILSSGVSFAKHLVQSSLAVIAILIISVVAWGVLLRVSSPKPLIVVDPFEVLPELGKEVGLDGKNAADIFIDQINETAKAAQAFHGSQYGSKHHYTQLSHLFRVPVQSSYGLQISGISIDDLIGLYRRVRYEEWKISGDIFRNAPGLSVRVRLRRGQDSQLWEIAAPPGGNAEAAIRDAAQQMLTVNQPEAMGRAYMQWGIQAPNESAKNQLFALAVDNFRIWANSNPTNPLPFYYMALAYQYRDDTRNSLDLAEWSEETANFAKEWNLSNTGLAKGKFLSLWHASSGAAQTVDLDQNLIANADLDEAKKHQASNAADSTPSQSQTQQARKIQESFADLKRRYPADLEYSNGYAVSINNLSSMSGDSHLISYRRAVSIETEVVNREPDNGGFRVSLAHGLQNIADFDRLILEGKRSPPSSEDKNATQKEMVQSMQQAKLDDEVALHLMPDSDDALHTLVEVVQDENLPNPMPNPASLEKSIHICRTVILLSPDPSVLKKVYARYLIHMYLVVKRDSEKSKPFLSLEKDPATRLLDQTAIQQAVQDATEEYIKEDREDDSVPKEKQEENIADDRDFWSKTQSQFLQELGLTGSPTIPAKPR